jgi:hypothetical protein
MVWVPNKVCFEKHCNLCKKHGGAYTCTTLLTVVGLRKTERRNLISVPLNHNFAQLTKKNKKLEKALKRSGKKGKKRHYKDSNSDSE